MAMNRFRISMHWCTLVIVLTLLLLTTETARGALLTSPSWHLVPAPEPDKFNDLASVDASSPIDVWAVGYSSNSYSFQPSDPLIEHYNGKSWSIFPSPAVGTSSGFAGVTAISSSDAWAVGDSTNGTLIEQWNGTSWSVVSSPNPKSNVSYLNAVSADSASDIWAVGASQSGNLTNTLIEHWNGTSWSIVPSPNTSSAINYLASVAAFSANDVWAVGYTQGSIINSFFEHWNGTNWSIVAGPNTGPLGSHLYSVTAVSTNDVWAVGDFVNYTDDKNVNQTLIEHWNGTSWSIIPSPNIGKSNNLLTSVSAISANDIWASGDYVKYPTAATQTETQNWNGTSWSVVTSPNVTNAQYNDLQGLAAINSQNVWTVGYYSNITDTYQRILTEHYCC